MRPRIRLQFARNSARKTKPSVSLGNPAAPTDGLLAQYERYFDALRRPQKTRGSSAFYVPRHASNSPENPSERQNQSFRSVNLPHRRTACSPSTSAFSTPPRGQKKLGDRQPFTPPDTPPIRQNFRLKDSKAFRSGSLPHRRTASSPCMSAFSTPPGGHKNSGTVQPITSPDTPPVPQKLHPKDKIKRSVR